jgi:diguanylate cyclase (GGDEF)-like protein
VDTQLIERPSRTAAGVNGASPVRAAAPDKSERSSDASWLCPSASARERMLDMDERLAPVRMVTLLALALVALSQSYWIGLWTLLPIIPAAAAFALAGRITGHTDRPEYALFGAFVVAELVIAGTISISGEPLLLAWLTIPVVTLSARFSLHGVIAGTAVAIALMLLVALTTLSQAVMDYPPTLVMPLAVVMAVGILSTALMRSDVEHRDEAVIDQLTGMLNRHALSRRAGELEQQSRVSGEPVAVVVADIDCFKNLNDTLGHAVGDDAIIAAARLLRTTFRDADVIARLGGDEFCVIGVLPGPPTDGSSQLLRLHKAVGLYNAREGAPFHLSLSGGLSIWDPHAPRPLKELEIEADRRMYADKQSKRLKAM